MISVILPTKNEPSIKELIKKIHTILKKEKHEIVVIDISDVAPGIKDARLYKQKTKGLGNAILEGVEKSNGNEIVIMDADFSHNPKYIPSLIKKLRKGNDIVIGSRYCDGGSTEDVGLRMFILSNSFISRFYCGFASLLLNPNVMDPMSGFVAVRKKVYDSIYLNPRGYKVNLEMIFKARKMGYKISEIPITFYTRKGGRSKAGLCEGIRTLIFMVELKLGLR